MWQGGLPSQSPLQLTCPDPASLPCLVMPQVFSLMSSDPVTLTHDLRNKTGATCSADILLLWFNQSITFSLNARFIDENSLELVAMMLKIYRAWEEPSHSI